jgi:hypothetical protein
MLFKCPKCDNEYINIISLSKHWSRTHKEQTKLLYMHINNLTIAPTCGCGCGQEVKFLDAGRGFSEYVWGHKARVKNNFNTEKSKTNSIKTRRKMLEEGNWKPFHEKETGTVWNSGLTKHDPRVAAAIEKRETVEYKKKSSERMREARLSGKIPTLHGENHSQWKGGTSPLLSVCHANKKLFDKWKYPILEASQFSCKNCGKQNRKGNSVELHVHHDKIKMSSIVRLIAEQEGWNESVSLKIDNSDLFEMKNRISNAVADFHIENKVSGIVLCVDCHKDLHDKMNF